MDNIKIPILKYFLVNLIFILPNLIVVSGEDYCPIDGPCELKSQFLPKFLLYDVNPPEGFNLRRDVYMRLAIFMNKFYKTNGDWHLVLPRWHHLYHWKSVDAGEQNSIPWSHFFNVDELKKFAPVIEFNDFLKDWGNSAIDQIFVLQHFSDAFRPGYDFSDKWEIQKCHTDHLYKRNKGGEWDGWFWGEKNMTGRDLKCVSFQGSASNLEQLLDHSSSARSVVIDRAEVVLHDYFGDKKYWECRRSMKFADSLSAPALNFMKERLGWRGNELLSPVENNEEGERRGGSYLAVHFRRRDFVMGRSSEAVPVTSAAEQIMSAVTQHNLSKVFLATDTTDEEFETLAMRVGGAEVIRYRPKGEEKRRLKDGGIAVVDQIICSHARWFIGTHESTFSFRIQEEREILGLHSDSTFNRLCPHPDIDCRQPTRWNIVL